MRLIRLPQVRSTTGDGTTKVYQDIQDGLLPRPVKRARSSYWPEHEIDAVVAARIAGRTDDQIRILVAELVAARQNLLPQIAAQRGTAATEAAA
jgi:prophage regulatory protein